jgi:hypothetical protein
MAWITHHPNRDALGHAVRCVKLVGDALIEGITYPDVWLVEYHDQALNWEGRPFAMPDAWLTPWTNPGDDEVDQMLLSAGSPYGADFLVV